MTASCPSTVFPSTPLLVLSLPSPHFRPPPPFLPPTFPIFFPLHLSATPFLSCSPVSTAFFSPFLLPSHPSFSHSPYPFLFFPSSHSSPILPPFFFLLLSSALLGVGTQGDRHSPGLCPLVCFGQEVPGPHNPLHLTAPEGTSRWRGPHGCLRRGP